MNFTSALTSIKSARKPHVCYWCGESIPVGSSYVQWSYSDDGKMRTTRAHAECEKVWSKAQYEDIDYGMHMTLGEHSRGCICMKGNCQCQKDHP